MWLIPSVTTHLTWCTLSQVVQDAVQEAVAEAVATAFEENVRFDVRANFYTLIAITGVILYWRGVWTLWYATAAGICVCLWNRFRHVLVPVFCWVVPFSICFSACRRFDCSLLYYIQLCHACCRDYFFGFSIYSEFAAVATGFAIMLTMRLLQVPLVESLPGG